MTSEDGLLGFNALPLSLARGPTSAWLDGNVVAWTHDHQNRQTQDQSAEGLLDAFVRLQSPEGVLAFVQTWGAVWFCPTHKLPLSHGLTKWSVYEWSSGVTGLAGECFPDKAPSFRDPVELYLSFAARARAILRLAVQLHEANETHREDWRLALGAFLPEEYWHDEADLEAFIFSGKQSLADVVTEWMRVGGVSPYLQWLTDEPAFTFVGGNFGVIGLQLMQAITRSYGIVICSSCGIPYMRKGRRPQAGRRNYCPDCGSKAWLRDAQRDFQARRKKHGQAG